MRPDTLLPRGCGDNGPEYDYADGVTLHLYEIRDGSMRVAEVRLPVPPPPPEPVLQSTAQAAGAAAPVEPSAF